MYCKAWLNTKSSSFLFFFFTILFRDISFELDGINSKYCIRASAFKHKTSNSNANTTEKNDFSNDDQNDFIKKLHSQIFEIWDKIEKQPRKMKDLDVFFAEKSSCISPETSSLFLSSYVIKENSLHGSASTPFEITGLNDLYSSVDSCIDNILDFKNFASTYDNLMLALKKYENTNFLLSGENNIAIELRIKIEKIIQNLHPYHKILLPEFESIRDILLRFLSVKKQLQDKYPTIYLLVSLLDKILSQINDDKSNFKTYLYIYNIDINMETNNKRLILYLRLVMVSLLKYIDIDAYKLLEYSALILLESFIYSPENIQSKHKLFYLNVFIKMYLRIFHLSNYNGIEIYEKINRFLDKFFADEFIRDYDANNFVEWNIISIFSKIFPKLNIASHFNIYIEDIKSKIIKEVETRRTNLNSFDSYKIRVGLAHLFRRFIPNFKYENINSKQVIEYPEFKNILQSNLSFYITQNIYICYLNNILVYIFLDDSNLDFIHFSDLYTNRSSLSIIMRAEMHEEPAPPLKQASKEEYGVKTENKENNTLLISEEVTTLEEPTNNKNKESDLEEET
ncbi:hypothetical protein CWI36_0911p0010, partial [Hamiltosporidium magnivora]